MVSARKSVLVQHSAQQLFALVEATDDYPAFLPWALETLIGPEFDRIADSFIDAFVRRAESVYAA